MYLYCINNNKKNISAHFNSDIFVFLFFVVFVFFNLISFQVKTQKTFFKHKKHFTEIE